MRKEEVLYLAGRAGIDNDTDPEALVAFASLIAVMERRECRRAAMDTMSRSENWDVKNGVMHAVNAITARGGIYE